MINFIPSILSKISEDSIHYKYLQVKVLAHDFNLALNAVVSDNDNFHYLHLIYSFLNCDLNDLKFNAFEIYNDYCSFLTDIHIGPNFNVSDATIEKSKYHFLPRFPFLIDHLTIVNSQFTNLLGLSNVKSLSLYNNPNLTAINSLPLGLELLEVVDSSNLRYLSSIPNSVRQLSLVNNPKLQSVDGQFKFLNNLTIYDNPLLTSVDFSNCQYIESSYIAEQQFSLVQNLLR